MFDEEAGITTGANKNRQGRYKNFNETQPYFGKIQKPHESHVQVLTSDINEYNKALINSHGTPGGGKIFTGKISYTDEG